MRLHPLLPDRLYQQNHCGIYRLDRPAEQWQDLGATMPKSVGAIGFPVVLHPRDPDTLWVFPMDGSSVWPRVSPGGKPAVYRSRQRRQVVATTGDGPAEGTGVVHREAPGDERWMTRPPTGVYFATTSGEVWASRDEGRTWKCIAAHLPHIYAVEVA